MRGDQARTYSTMLQVNFRPTEEREMVVVVRPIQIIIRTPDKEVRRLPPPVQVQMAR